MVRGLLQQGFKVYAHSSDSGRLKKLLAKSAGQLHVTTSLVDGLHVSQWVVGKCDKKATGPGTHPKSMPRSLEDDVSKIETCIDLPVSALTQVLGDPEVKHYLPQGAKAVVFSVPNPLEGRPDLQAMACRS